MEDIYESKETAHRILQHHREGRPIVWFIGSGISINAGYPGIQDICGYLAQLQFAITTGLHHDRHVGLSLATGNGQANRTSEIVELYGWPTPEQLSYDMWRWLSTPPTIDSNKNLSPKKIFAEHLLEFFKRKNLLQLTASSQLPAASGKEEKIRSFYANVPTQLWLHHVENAVNLSELASRTDARLANTLAESLITGDYRAPRSESKSIRGDWASLMDTLTEGRGDLVDSLFGMFGETRKPSATHILLASLIKALGSKLVLTTNFDSLFEQAVNKLKIACKIFDVFRDATVPHPLLVTPHFSIVKLHGSAYGLRVGERLQSALDGTTREHILGYLPDGAIVVVIGFSGWERRMMQLLESWAIKHSQSAFSSKTSVEWLHFEANSQPCIQLKERLRSISPKAAESFKNTRICDAETFLSSCYSLFASAYPASPISYEYLSPPRVSASIPLKPEPECRLKVFSPNSSYFPELTGEQLLDWSKCKLTLEQASVREEAWKFINDPSTPKDPSAFGTIGSLALAKFSAQRRETHTTISIDLEPHHTLQGVITELFRRMRVLDPSLPEIHFPSSLFSPNLSESFDRSMLTDADAEEEIRAEIEKARLRIQDALKRRRYLICFDRLEGFARPQTMHHGTPNASVKNDQAEHDSKQFFMLCEFLCDLAKDIANCDKCGDAILAVAADIPRQRHDIQDPADKPGCLWHDSYLCVSLFLSRIGKLDGNPIDALTKERQKSQPIKIETGERVGECVTVINDSPEAMSDTYNLSAVTHRVFEFSKSLTDREALPTVLLTTMALMRKPRSTISIRSVIGTHFASKARTENCLTREFQTLFEDGIKSLAAEHKVILLEGEVVWLPTALHEHIYKKLSRNSHDPNIRALLSENRLESETVLYATTIDQLLALSYWHRRYARHFYSGVFLPSRDLEAFWEYLYHRTSGLRYLASAQILLAHASLLQNSQVGSALSPSLPFVKLLRTLCKNAGFSNDDAGADDSPWTDEELRQQLGRYFSRLQLYDKSRGNAYAVDGMVELDPDEINRVLGENRRRQILSLTASLRRERETLFSSLPAETVLGWSRQLLRREIPAFSGLRILDDMDCECPQKKNLREKIFNNDIKSASKEFRRTVSQLASVVTYLRRDYRRAHHVVWEAGIHLTNEQATSIQLALEIPANAPNTEERVSAIKLYAAAEGVLSKKLSDAKIDEEVCKRLDLPAVKREISFSALKVDDEAKDRTREKWNNYAFRASTAEHRAAMSCDGQTSAIPEPEAISEFVAKICILVDGLRHSSNSKLQLGAGTFATFLHRLATTILHRELDEISSCKAVSVDLLNRLKRVRLSNLRREIDLELVDFPLWIQFCPMRPPGTVGEASGLDNKLKNMQKKCGYLEEMARESEFLSADEYFEYRSDSILTNARVNALLGRFMEAHRLLDRATAGLSPTSGRHAIWFARAAFIRAESLLMSVHTNMKNMAAVGQGLKAADEKSEFNPLAGERIQTSNMHCQNLLQRASACLTDCEDFVSRGRQDLSAWIDLFLGKAQLAFEELLLQFDCFDKADLWDGTWSHRQFSAHVERRLDESLKELRCAIDSIPFQKLVTFDRAVKEPQHRPELMALSLWLRLLVIGDILLRQARFKELLDQETGYLRSVGDSSPVERIKTFSSVSLEHQKQDDLQKYFHFFAELSRGNRFSAFADHLLHEKEFKVNDDPASSSENKSIFSEMEAIRKSLASPSRSSEQGKTLRTRFLEKADSLVKDFLPVFWKVRRQPVDAKEVKAP